MCQGLLKQGGNAAEFLINRCPVSPGSGQPLHIGKGWHVDQGARSSLRSLIVYGWSVELWIDGAAHIC